MASTCSALRNRRYEGGHCILGAPDVRFWTTRSAVTLSWSGVPGIAIGAMAG